mgnify:CR=1 FL=1
MPPTRPCAVLLSAPRSGWWQIGPRHRVRMNRPHLLVVGVSVPGKVSREEALSLPVEPLRQLFTLERLLLAELAVRQALG